MKPTAFRACSAFFALLAASPASPCIPPPPPLQLSGESDESYRARAEVFTRATLDEERRAWQTRLYENATRVSLARVTASTTLPGVLSDGLSSGRRVELQPIAVFKGAPAAGEKRSVQDAGMTTCGLYGGGTATTGSPGDYVILFEDADPNSPTGHLGFRLTDLREPRILSRFSEVVQAARAVAPRK